MSDQPQFDPTLLSGVKPGMDAALAEMSVHLEQYLAAPTRNANALSTVRGELHRLLGVLKMVHLDGVAVFCTELETVLDELSETPALVSALHRDVLRRALFGLANFLDSLSRSGVNAALYLFPQYQELLQLRGMEMAFESDLFFPDLTVPLPDSVRSIPRQNDAIAHVKTARSQYQQGLMRYLRQDDVPAALHIMQQALDIVLSCAPQDDSRAFWWVAEGLLDCVRLDGLPPDLSARKLFGRIDRQMRAVIEGNGTDLRPVMNEMLYLIGRSHSVSELVERIKSLYALDLYLPELSELPPGEITQILELMHEQLRAAEENWELCTQGDEMACKRFAGNVGHLAQQGEKLERGPLQLLTKHIQASSRYVSDIELARLGAMDMAMALLLLNSGIAHYSHLGSGFQEQVRILSERMQAVLNQQPENAQRLEELVDLHCRMGQDEVTVSLASEMLVNLQHVEQSLNTFFGDASKLGELKGLPRLLGQIHGGLRILSLERAEQLLLAILDSVNTCEQAGTLFRPAESLALASAVSALESCLQHLVHGQKDGGKALLAALEELTELRQPAAPTATAPAAQPGESAELQRPLDEDQELLEVFLEEAQEVLSIMRDNLDICLLHPDSQEPIITIRRGFHTLKGSGRMVGLADLGEVAWAIERGLNKWLLDKQTASPNLLQFIMRAEQAFSGWVEALGSQGGVRIEAADLVAMAQQIERGLDPDVAPRIETAEAPVLALAESPPEPEQVVIGEIALSPTLFKIASEEAKQNALVLQKQFAEMRAFQPCRVQYDFMRAAHTLAGVNRTMGFKTVAELAYALEGWLQTRIEQPFVLGEVQLHMLEQAISALGEMAQSVCGKQMPQAHTDLTNQLLADKDRLDEEVALPQETEAPAPPVLAPAAAEAKQATEQSKPKKPQVRDDVDEQLLPVFLEEADDLIPKIGSELRAWREQPDDKQPPQMLQRLLHTLKGSARMAGAMRIGEIAHEMEDRVQSAAPTQDQAGYWDALDADSDRITALLGELRGGKSKTAEGDAAEIGRRMIGPANGERRALDIGAERALLSMLRVRSDVVDRLVNEASEISVARSRMEAELRAFKEGLLELTGSVARLRKQLREVEIQADSQMQARVSLLQDSTEQFDPLEFDRFTRLQELTRFMSESVHDVQTVQQSLLKNIDETAAAISAQARLNRELQQGLMNVRMMPFSSISERLYRIVRQTCKELNKRANLELAGTTVELDRSVLEKMTAPFEHLLRNAIAHGLEMPEQRERQGKTAIGEIRLSLRQESNEVVFEFSDDGTGLDMARLQQKALEYGVLQKGEAISDEQAIQMIFKPGLSTAKEVTEISGRGVGLDVVRSEVSALGGRLDVVTAVGKGLCFTIHLPLTLAVTRTLMVRAGKDVYALPATMIEQVQQVKPQALEAMYGARQVEWQGKTYPLHYLQRLLGNEKTEIVSRPYNAILLLHSGENRIALHADEMIGNQEVVVKNIGPQLARLPGIAGATVTGSGAVVLIINPIMFAQQISFARKTVQDTPAAEPVHRIPLVMVVDDSLTVRKITSRLLVRAGYQVVTAKDGVDAMEQLVDLSPAVMLLDVEMPRMDGFELAKRLRQDSKTKDLPIIMITSRTAEKHRNRALEIGVNEYMGKPYQDDALLAFITRFAPLSEIDMQL
ncbi:MAG: response regulator [Gallionellaceae bacterium]|nr:MAG: response regulator [Gallionellaceae bacterium]